MVNPGTQGGVALGMYGGYVEGNAGVADVWLRHDNPAFAAPASASVFEISGTGFMRVTDRDGERSNQFVALDFVRGSGLSAAASLQLLRMLEQPRAALRFIGAQQQRDISLDLSSSLFPSNENVDEYVCEVPTVSRPSAVKGFRASASASARFARRWRTATVQGSVTIACYGVGGRGSINVTLPYVARSGMTYTPVQVYDPASGNAVQAVVVPGTDCLTMKAVPAGDSRLLQYSVTYAMQ